MGVPYNPLAKINLGRSVAEALLLGPVVPLKQVTEIAGAGVYAIYYTGAFEPYLPIAEKNRNGVFSQPIYVGKAVTKGARKGGLTFDASKGKALRDGCDSTPVLFTKPQISIRGIFDFGP